MRPPDPTPYDVAIVGAGPAGSAAAIHLARAGWRVALLDRAAFPRDKPCAECLSPAADPLLADLGVLHRLDATQPARLHGFRIYAPGGHVFQGDYAGVRDPAGHLLHSTGLSVQRRILDTALVDAARDAGAGVHPRWPLAQLERGADSLWTLTPTPAPAPAPSTATSGPLRARLLIAADGVHSTVARRLGLHVPGRMRKIALVAHLHGLTGLDDFGEMHAAARRYVGLARVQSPAAGDLSTVAMVVDEARDAPALAGRAEAFFWDTFASFPALRERLTSATLAGRLQTTSRLTVTARRLSDAGLLLVGDATGYYDPFTGEGIYRALQSAALAASVADDALRAGDLSAARLARYARLHARAFRGKLLVQKGIQLAIEAPALMDHAAARLARRPSAADTLLGVTGDYLPPSAVLRPSYLLRLLA